MKPDRSFVDSSFVLPTSSLLLIRSDWDYIAW